MRVFSRNISPTPIRRLFQRLDQPFFDLPQTLTFEKSGSESSVRSGGALECTGSRTASPSVERLFARVPESPHNLSCYRSRSPPNPITERSRRSSLSFPQSFTLSAGKPCQARVRRGVNVFNKGSRVFTSTTLYARPACSLTYGILKTVPSRETTMKTMARDTKFLKTRT